MYCVVFRSKAKKGKLEHIAQFMKEKGIALMSQRPGAVAVYFVTRPDGEYNILYFVDTMEHVQWYLEGPERKKALTESVLPLIEASPNVVVYEVQAASVPVPG